MRESGLSLFLRYAEPCLPHRLKRGLISPEDEEAVKWHIDEKIKPETKLVEHCFPDAVADYQRYCSKKGYEPDYSRDSVADYWRHNHVGRTSVTIGLVVCADNGIVYISHSWNNQIIPIANPRKIEVRRGDKVTCHANQIIEKL